MFDRIPRAETPHHYLEVALTRGRTAASRVKRISDRVILTKTKERDRMRAVQESLVRSLMKVHDGYPSFDAMSEFTVRLFSLDMEPGRAKQALGGVHTATEKIKTVTREQMASLARANDIPALKKVRDAFLGRIQSILKQTEKHLLVMNEARAIFRGLPEVDDALFTVAIAGFPNVGKSTLLRKLTKAKPAVEAYAFTTKGLNLGYFTYKYNRIQCIDTPGALDRVRMNTIEKKADITLRYLANCIVYVFDPTENYPLAKQQALYEKLVALDVPMLVYVSKTDLVTTTLEGYTDPEELKKAIIDEFLAWN